MTEELTQRAERAVNKFEHASTYLESARFEAMVAESLEHATVAAVSPWLNRRGAAAYCRCSPTSIDRAAAQGIIKRYLRAETPLFLKSELDEAIRSGRWRVK